MANEAGPVALQRGLQICLLNSPHLLRPDGAQLPLERKDAALLAILALDGPTARGKLAALLWPETDEAKARSNLRQRLFRLRRSAGQDVVHDQGALQLADEVTLDLTEAKQHLASNPHAGAGALLGAHDYGDGDELESWVMQARNRWGETRLALLAQQASQLEQEGALAAALAYAQHMASENPALEHAHRRVMRLHYLRGDRAAALSAYQHCCEVIGRQIGTRPGAETAQLAGLIERSGALPQAAPRSRPIAALRPPRLVGRDREWGVLAAAMQARRAMLILGEPGIGKTRLLGDFAAGKHRSPVVGARPGDRALPYALMARIVRRLEQDHGLPATPWARQELARVAPEFGAAPATPLAPLRLQQALASALADWSAAGLGLLAVDDLQFADEATLELLLPLVGAASGPPVAWLLAAREHELPARVAEWLVAEDAIEMRRVVLGPLDPAGVQALLASLALPGLDAAAWAPPLARHTGGNPMYILETLIALLDADPEATSGRPPELPAPPRIGALIERRLGQLSAPALKLARVAALSGQDFDADVAAAVLDQHPLDIAEAWRELEAAQVIGDNSFAHDLIFEATLRSVPDAIARPMHREIARVLAARSAPPARLAAHWFAAGEWQLAAEAFAEAARRAGSASRRAEEADLWDRVVASFEHAGDHGASFEARCSSLDAVMASRPISQALALTQRLLADAQGDGERLAALLGHATVMLVSNRPEEAHAAAIDAGALARALARHWDEFDAARCAATALAQLRRAAEGLPLLETFMSIVNVEGTPAQRLNYWSDLAYVSNLADRRRNSVQAWKAAIEQAQALGDLHQVITGTTNLTGVTGQLGLPLQAHAYAERAYRLRSEADETDDVVSGACEMNLAMWDAVIGRFDRALTLYESAGAKFSRSGASVWLTACESNHAFALLMLGQHARAMQTLQRPMPAATPLHFQARRLILGGRLARALDGSALPKLALALELLDQRDDRYMRLLAELDRSRELDPAAAVELCRCLAAQADAVEQFAAGSKARVFEIEAHLRAGAASVAAPAAAQLSATFEGCRPGDLYWPEVLWIVYRALEAGGDHDAATAALDQAAHWIVKVALPHVPEAYRDAFLHRNPINRAVLARWRPLQA